MPEGPLDPLSQRVNLRKRALRRAAIASGLQLLDQVGGIGDDAAAEFVTRYGPMHQATIVSTGRLVDAYVDGFLRAHGQTPSGTPVDTDRLRDEIRIGTTLEEEFERPFVTARTAIAKGEPFDVAMAAAANRLQSLVGTDVQQGFRLAMAERIGSGSSIPGYRRVLVGAENCALCITASTVRYRSDKLMPIHPGCDCGIAPLDPGTSVNRAGTLSTEVPRLDQVKQIIRDEGISYTDRAGLTALKVNVDGLSAVEEVAHGELGPVLAFSKHRSTALPWTRQSRREFGPDGELIRS